MYNTHEEVLNSLVQNKTSLKNIQTQMSKWRKKKNLDKVMMFHYAIETYKMFYLEENE